MYKKHVSVNTHIRNLRMYIYSYSSWYVPCTFSSRFYVLATLLLYIGIVIEGPSNVTYIPGQTPLPIELICNVTGFPTWIVDGSDYTLSSLIGGGLTGHNVSGTNILVEAPVNNTEYICVSNSVMTGLETDRSEPAFLSVARK